MTSSPLSLRRTTAMGGGAGLVFTGGWQEAQALARALRAEQPPGVVEVVPAADSVGVLVDDGVTSVGEALELAAGLAGNASPATGRHVEVEVCFDGSDLDGVAEHAGLSVSEVVSQLADTPLSVGWLGFMPGFPYLVGLGEPLASVPRLARPRPRLAAGSFALAGGYAGIYPSATPGGWNVLGRAAIQLFDATKADPATLAPSDLVRIRPVDSLAPERPPARLPITAGGPRRVRVIEAGARALVQDRGRLGVAHLGVPPAGPADALRHRIANSAVGNPGTSGVLEITLAGPSLQFRCDAFVALVGDCPLRIDGRAMPPSSVQFVEQGQIVSIGAVERSLHAYLGISGGIEITPVLGSRATDATSGLWPGPLRAGDELDLGRSGRARGRWFEPPAFDGVLQVVVGPDGTGSPAAAAALARLLSMPFAVARESDRVGTRLVPLEAEGAPDTEPSIALPATASRATVTGAVQLPPDGCPIVLGPDRGTVGGYPVVAVVIGASLPACGQLCPGDVVRFEQAASARASAGAGGPDFVTGWMPLDLDSGSGRGA
ncbi:MAG: carboxyltransferase domain-containing protein [Acidimicrobiales bacterium]